MTTKDAHVFIISRHFDAPIEQVYDAWADPHKMAAWSGPKGATVKILAGELAVGQQTISCTSPQAGDDMYSLCKWVALDRPTRVVWEQSFSDTEGNKCAPPFFDDWPLTLLTEVDLTARDGGTEVTLRWTPIEYTPAALAMFEQQMNSMTGGWGGSFDKLAEYLRVSD